MLTPGDAQIEYRSANGRPPCIVFEAGAGDDLSTWTQVLALLARRRRCLAYSRPGYGRSAPGKSPRDIWTMARELHAFLEQIEEHDPILLVGHSLGGLIVEAFAVLFPLRVAGLVLVDPTHPDLIQRMRKDVPEQGTEFEAAVKKLPSETARAEIQALIAGTALPLLTPPHLFQGPVVVLGAWVGNYSSQYLEHHRLLIRETAKRYPSALLRRVHCGHYIQSERPRAIVQAVNNILGST